MRTWIIVEELGFIKLHNVRTCHHISYELCFELSLACSSLTSSHYYHLQDILIVCFLETIKPSIDIRKTVINLKTSLVFIKKLKMLNR